MLVDEGHDQDAPGRASSPAGRPSRIQVRFPRLEPGYLIDVIGLRRGPATSRPSPGHLAAGLPRTR